MSEPLDERSKSTLQRRHAWVILGMAFFVLANARLFVSRWALAAVVPTPGSNRG